MHVDVCRCQVNGVWQKLLSTLPTAAPTHSMAQCTWWDFHILLTHLNMAKVVWTQLGGEVYSHARVI